MRTSPFLGFAGALVALALAAPSALAAPADGAAPTLVVLGDSLSAAYGIRPEEGWVALLAKRLDSEGYGYRVVNASVSGETSAGGLARLPRVLSAHSPAILVVELGANDGLRGLEIPQMKQNLSAILAEARAAKATVLLIGMQIPSNYGPEYTARFSGTFAEVAHAGKVALVPFLLEKVAMSEANFQADRLHPIAAAEPQVLDTVWAGLKPLLHAPFRPKTAATRPAAVH